MITQQERQALSAAMTDIQLEALRAREMHPAFTTLHEAAAVIREEHDELWDAIKIKRPLGPADQFTWREALRKDATQLGATALQFLAQLDTLT